MNINWKRDSYLLEALDQISTLRINLKFELLKIKV